jgi:hypothetical protein
MVGIGTGIYNITSSVFFFGFSNFCWFFGLGRKSNITDHLDSNSEARF